MIHTDPIRPSTTNARALDGDAPTLQRALDALRQRSPATEQLVDELAAYIAAQQTEHQRALRDAVEALREERSPAFALHLAERVEQLRAERASAVGLDPVRPVELVDDGRCPSCGQALPR